MNSSLLVQPFRDLREQVRGKVERHLDHAENCDEGWTQGVCVRCDLLASLEVTFGFAYPLAEATVSDAASVPLYTDARRAEFPPGTSNLEIALTDALNVYHDALRLAADMLAQGGYDTDPNYRHEWQTIKEALDG